MNNIFDHSYFSNDEDLLGSEPKSIRVTQIARKLAQEENVEWVFIVNHFDGQNYLEQSIVVLHKEGTTPLITVNAIKPKGKCSWVLADDPERWHFIPCPAIGLDSSKSGTPEQWGNQEFIREMRFWPPSLTISDSDDEKKLEGRFAADWAAKSMWLEYLDLGYNHLESLLLHTPLCNLKPYADFSIATLNFCVQIYSKSELAQRAANKEHLWFCCEYSECLRAIRGSGLTGEVEDDGQGKTETTKKIAAFIAASKKVLKHDLLKGGDLPELVTIEWIQSQGVDWRERIIWLLISEAIRIVWFEGDDDLKHHCTQFLNAYARYNRILDRSKLYEASYLNAERELQTTAKSKKLSRSKSRKKGFKRSGAV